MLGAPARLRRADVRPRSDLHGPERVAGRAGGYEGWRAGATREEVSEGLTIQVAALDDVIDSKRAANRPKDQMALPYLESLRDELGER
jgi:hypothetical protein